MSDWRIRIYRTADRALLPRLMWNDYDYRPEGGSLYRIGVALHIGRRCLSVVWGQPGTDFGHA